MHCGVSRCANVSSDEKASKSMVQNINNYMFDHFRRFFAYFFAKLSIASVDQVIRPLSTRPIMWPTTRPKRSFRSRRRWASIQFENEIFRCKSFQSCVKAEIVIDRSPTWSCLTLFKARVMLFLGHISSHRGTKEMVECGVNLIKAEQTWWNIETQILLRMMGKYGNVLLILKTWRFLTACVSLFVYWARIKSRNYLQNPIDTI